MITNYMELKVNEKISEWNNLDMTAEETML